MGRHREVNGTCGVVQESIQVELLLTGCDIELQVLFTIHTTKAGRSIKRPRATSVVEAHHFDVARDIVSNHKTTQRHDATQAD